MKISNKEKMMLSILGIAALGVGYYYLGYTPMKEKVDVKRLELQTLEDDYSKKQTAIATMPKNEKDIKLLNFSIEDANKKIYPGIWQPQLIKDIEELKKKSGLKLQLAFTEAVYAPISDYFISKEEEVNLANTLEATIEEYNSKVIDAENKISYKRLNNGEILDAKKPVDQNKKEEEKSDAGINVQQMKITTSYKGSYKELMKFLELVSNYKYKVAITEITMAPSGTNEMNGSFVMEFYSVPRVTNSDDGYYDWEAVSKSGKDNPFLDSYTSVGNIQNQENEAVSVNLVLTTSKSDMPAISIARPNDAIGRSKIISDDNKIENAIIEFTQQGSEYFVKYKLGDKVYPDTGAIDFVPKGNSIGVNIKSEKRFDLNDLVALKLHVKNSTDKQVRIEITGDDTNNPRVKLATDGDVYHTRR
ncbi:MAG: hypothetical protein ACRCYE_09165 [Sarcina sp.]